MFGQLSRGKWGRESRAIDGLRGQIFMTAVGREERKKRRLTGTEANA